jgi:hypothetical protein
MNRLYMHIYDRGIKTAHKNPDSSYAINCAAYITKGNICFICTCTYVCAYMKSRGFSKTPDLVAHMKRKQSECLGHVVRIGQTVVAEKFSESKSDGRSKMKRHRVRWLEDAEYDL